jgi:hypothetical protein
MGVAKLTKPGEQASALRPPRAPRRVRSRSARTGNSRLLSKGKLSLGKSCYSALPEPRGSLHR